jgi:DNA polymerase-3 subunit beta
MNFVISSTELLSSLQTVSKVIKSKNTQPILDNFLFKLENGTLTITASDLESTLSTKHVLDNSNEEGIIAIDAKRLMDIVKEFPEQPITMNIDNETKNIDIITSNGKFSVVGIDAEDFPNPQKISNDDRKSFVLPSELVLEGINKTIFAVADDELRPVMNGIFIQASSENIRFVATDSHKLVRYTRSDVEIENDGDFILPHKPANILRTILPKEKGNVALELDNKNAIFTTETYTLVCRLIEGSYPNYAAVIPSQNPIKVTVDRLDLYNSLKRVSACSSQSSNLVRLDFAPNTTKVSAQDIDFSIAGHETINSTLEGNEITIGFKSLFLIEIINNLTTPEITVELSDPARAGIIVPKSPENENEDTLMLLMPMMINH